jgi:hypothetical protein
MDSRRAFLAEAKKANLALEAMTGQEMEQIVAGLFRLGATQIVELKEAAAPK